MPATITEIARIARVNRSTVSRLVRGDSRLRISDQRKRELLRIIEKQGGCAPHRTGQALAAQRSGVLLWPINRNQQWIVWQNAYVGQALMQAAEQEVRQNAGRLAVLFFNQEKRHEELPDLFRQPDFCDGMFFSTSVMDQRLAKIVRQLRYPHVVVLDPSVEGLGVHRVIADQRTGITQAIEHLKQLGHRRIGFIGGETPMDRVELFRLCAREAGLTLQESDCLLQPLNPDVAGWDVTTRSLGQDAMSALLDRRACTAVFCGTDGFAFGAIDALKQRGLEPGRDRSVLGYDDLEHWGWRPFGEPMLTTVHNPLDQIGRRAAEVLLRQVDESWIEPETIRIPTHLIVRSTTGPASSP